MNPAIRIEPDYAAQVIGTLLAPDDSHQLIRQPDGVHLLNVFTPRPVKAVSVNVVGTFTRLSIPEHLCLECDIAKAPSGWTLSGEFPGAWQGAWTIGSHASGSFLLGALDVPPLPFPPIVTTLARGSVSVKWPGPFAAATPYKLRFFFAEEFSGTERERAYRLLDRYRTALGMKWGALLYGAGHGQINVQLQDQKEPLEHVARMWANYGQQFKRIQCWGQMSETQCCDPKYEIHGRYGGIRELGAAMDCQTAYVLGFYLRPDRGDGRPAADWLKAWRDDLIGDDAFVPSFYLDTAGFRDMRGCPVGSSDLIEGATLALPNPVLVSNCLSGGAFSPDGKARYPKTLPDGTPHPLNPEPWITSDPWLGKYLMRDRTMVLGHENTDAYYSALYWTTVDGQRKEWHDYLWKACLMLDLPMSVRDPSNATVQAIIAERHRVGWLQQDREWLGPGEWKDRRTGKRWKATIEPIAIVEVEP